MGELLSLLTQFSEKIGISLWILILLIVWSSIWKLLALWKSAKKGQVAWFIVLAIVNSAGILQILYFYIFSELDFNKKKKDKKKEDDKSLKKNKRKKK